MPQNPKGESLKGIKQASDSKIGEKKEGLLKKIQVEPNNGSDLFDLAILYSLFFRIILEAKNPVVENFQ